VPALNARGDNKFLKESMGEQKKKNCRRGGTLYGLNGSGKRWYLRRKAEIKIGSNQKAMPVRPSEQNIRRSLKKYNK